MGITQQLVTWVMDVQHGKKSGEKKQYKGDGGG